jgi:hypothetical protein
LALAVLQLVLPRRYAFVPVMVAGCYMTLGQALLISGFHFHLLRLLIVCGLARIVIRKEFSGIRLTGIDGVLIPWLLMTCFLYVLVDGTNVTAAGRIGDAYDVLGIYILVRASIRTIDDIAAVTKACALVIIPLGLLFLVESVTGRNPFSALGGVALLSEIRNGRVRCQGPFLHPILAGTFAATAIPPLVGLLVSGNGSRLLAALAILSSTIIVITSGSSGSVTAFILGTAGLICWWCRKMMRLIRWGMVFGLLVLAAVMKEPVWFLIARVSDLTGGGGWYRSALIDAAVNHFDEWWLFGTGYTAHWMATGIIANENSADIVNQFIAQGVRGGLLTLVLFIWLIVKCFKCIGTAVSSKADYSEPARFLMWSIGCALVGHVASFFSVSYFDQIIIFWYLLLGMIAAIAHQTDVMAVDAGAADLPARAMQQARFAHVRARPVSRPRISADERPMSIRNR